MINKQYRLTPEEAALIKRNRENHERRVLVIPDLHAPFIEPGFLFGIKTKSRGDITLPDGTEYTGENIFQDANIANVAWGIGGGMMYNLSDETYLTAGLYFHNGIIDITKNNNNSDDTKITLNRVALKIGVQF